MNAQRQQQREPLTSGNPAHPNVDGKLTCPVDVTHELTAFVNPILNLFGCCWPCGHVVEGEQSPCCAATRGQRSRSAERIVHMSIGLPVAKRFQAARRA